MYEVRTAGVLFLCTAFLLGLGGWQIHAQDTSRPGGSWRQWGGPDRNFVVEASGLADAWDDGGPPSLWSRPLGLGHSALVVDEGRLFTLYRPGSDSRGGPWESREVVVAMDTATGETIWEFAYASEPLDFGNGAGPHATPLVVGSLVFTVGTNKQLHALDKTSGEVVWSHDLVREYGAPPTFTRPAVKAGYAGSPVAYKDLIILQAGGEGQSVMAFRQRDGAVAWRSGDFLIAQAAPLIIDVDGQDQLVIVGGQTVNGLVPDTGALLWSFPHDTAGDQNSSMPVWGPDNLLFVSSGYNQGSRMLRLSRSGDETTVEEEWFTNRLRIMFANAIRIGDFIYGSDGDFGPALLTAVHAKTGETIWQERGFGRSSLLYADDKAILIDEDGDLVLLRLTPSRMEVLAQASIFSTTSWTVPTLVGTVLYARDREKVVALDLADAAIAK
jgi:outer membrane protein assembly factor BamB